MDQIDKKELKVSFIRAINDLDEDLNHDIHELKIRADNIETSKDNFYVFATELVDAVIDLHSQYELLPIQVKESLVPYFFLKQLKTCINLIQQFSTENPLSLPTDPSKT
jgi:succinylglutamate desuccinylase